MGFQALPERISWKLSGLMGGKQNKTKTKTHVKEGTHLLKTHSVKGGEGEVLGLALAEETIIHSMDKQQGPTV